MRRLNQFIKQSWIAAIHAFQFLTIIPMPRAAFSEEAARRSLVFYPFVGLVIGAFVSLAALLLQLLFPPIVTGVLTVIVWIVLTGALHLDGLMDTADGLLSHRPPERMLEIMRDSRVGAWAVLVCGLTLLLKSALLIAFAHMIAGSASVITMLLCLAAVPVLSRWFMAVAVTRWPYARKQGFGAPYDRGGWRMVILASAAAAICIAIPALLLSLKQAGLFFAGAIAVTALLGTGFASYVKRKLGGLTGDIYGALNELIELALLLVLVAWFYT